MAHSLNWSRRLLDELVKGDDPGALLTRESYADTTFCGLLFEYLDGLIFHNPAEGRRWAQVVPDFVRLIARADGEAGRREHFARLTQALVIYASACRAAGDPAAADELYRQAQALIEAESIDRKTQAEYTKRLAVLRACQARLAEALDMSDEALAALRKMAGDDDRSQELVSEALVIRGYVLYKAGRCSEAIAHYGEALRTTNPRQSRRSERTHLSAVHNLARVLARSTHGDKAEALELIRQAKRSLRGQVRSVGRYRLLWVEGITWAAVGLDRRAEKAFLGALEGFEALRLPWEIALVGLDLGEVLHISGEWGQLAELAAETYERFQLLSGETQALAALSQWRSAIVAQTPTDEITGKARELIAAGVFKGSGRKDRK